ncbi:MAG: hypothetical protein WCY93_00160 [Anaerolineaceae bacterium]
MLEKVPYGGWDNCYRLCNGKVELLLTGDVGPRIIRFSFINEFNVFKEYPDQIGKTIGNQWLIFGGHRLWHAPEALPRTYYPDREPVLIQEIENGLVVTQRPETSTGIQKQIEITLAPDKPDVYLVHRLINHNLWAIDTAPWTISVMAPGGVAILPLPPRGPHPEFLVPTSTLSIWPYTDLTDQRFTLGKKYILLRQDTDQKTPQKLGIFTSPGWGAYFNQGYLFIKKVPLVLDGLYPDMGTNFEVFTNEEMLELEALGPLEMIPSKGHIVLHEHWTLHQDVPAIVTEADVENVLADLDL